MKHELLRVALIGCGNIAQNHISTLKSLSDIEICAICDVNIKKAESIKARFSLDSRIYTDYGELLENERIDAVHIATPHHLHASMAIAALEKGVNVFLEKPLCITLDEIRALKEAESKSSAHLTVCFQNRCTRAVTEAKRIIDEDGGALSAYGTVFWERSAEYYTESGWRGSYKTEGGGVMINQAIHTIDLLCVFLGTPKSVIATKSNHHLKNVIEVEDTCEGIIFFESGRRGNFYATTSFSEFDSTAVFVKTKNHKIEIRNNTLFIDDAPTRPDGAYIGKAVYGSGHSTLIAEFYAALRYGRDTPIPISDAEQSLKILLAAYKSNDNEIII